MRTRHWLLALMVAAAAMACEFKVAGYTEQPRMTRDTTTTHAQVWIKWVSGVDELMTIPACRLVQDQHPDRIIAACAQREGDRCFVFTPKPRDFNDAGALARLGHEVFHCLGADHG